MDLGIEGRVALVTAGSRGLGRGVVDALAAEGARLVVAARGEESLAEVALNELSPLFAQMHSEVTRPSVPRERLLKASLSIVLYRVRKLLVILNAMLHNKTRYHASVSTSSVSTLFFLVGADAQHGCC